MVDRSTTAANRVEEVETGWADGHGRGVKRTATTKNTTFANVMVDYR